MCFSCVISFDCWMKRGVQSTISPRDDRRLEYIVRGLRGCSSIYISVQYKSISFIDGAYCLDN